MNQFQKTIVLDCGKNESTMYDGENCKRLSHSDVLNLPNTLEQGVRLICEAAHLAAPRTIKSLAQPFTASELEKFYQDCEIHGIDLKFFPQDSSHRARKYSNLEKSDETDPIAIYNLLRDFPEISLMQPRTNFSKNLVQEEGWAMKQHMNTLLNFARRYEYQHELDGNSQWIRDNIDIISEKLSDDAKSCFRLTDEFRYKKKNEKKGVKAGDWNFKKVKPSQIYAVLSTLQGKILEDGEKVTIINEPIKRSSTGELAGWHFAMRNLLCMSPNHMKGGVARSNLYYHGARNWIIARAKEEGFYLKGKNRGEFSKQEDEVFLKYRRIYRRSIKELFIAIKNILQS